MEKSPEAFRTISEVADDLGVPKHVLRFWEGKFAQLRPMKRGGGRRYYRPEDVDLLRGVRRLLYEDGYTIKGVQKILREQGVRYVMDAWRVAEDTDEEPPRHEIPELAAEARQSVGARPSAARPGLSSEQIAELGALVEELEACRKRLAEADA